MQKNSDVDRFLSGLAITKWDIKEFVDLLSEKTSEGLCYISVPPHFVKGPDEDFMNWLSRKPSEWHQKLYALLKANSALLARLLPERPENGPSQQWRTRRRQPLFLPER